MNSTIGLIILIFPALLPLFLAALLLLRPDSRRVSALGAWAALPGILISAFMVPGTGTTASWLLQGSEFGLDSIGRVFLFFTSTIWLAAGLYAYHWITDRDRGRFFTMFLLVMSGNIGLIVARDMLAFYLFFTIMSIGAYGLVIHDRNQLAHHAGRIYMTFVIAGDMMILVAMLFAARYSDGVTFTAVRDSLANSPDRNLIIALVLLGFGIKAGLPGMHVTLPLIYRAAPIPAGAVLGGAMLNAGLLGWLRFLPFGAEGLDNWGKLLMAVGLFAAFYGAIVGLLQRSAKVVLAYSSISQMGIITLGIGVALTAPDHTAEVLMVVTLYALHHAFAKTALFLGTGVAMRIPGRSILVGAALILPALALTGAPLTTGMRAKEALKETLSAAPLNWAGPAEALLPWMALATTLIVARYWWLVRPWVASANAPAVRGGPLRLLLVWYVVLALVLVAAWLVPLTTSPQLWQPAIVWQTSWPVLSGLVLAGLTVRVFRRSALQRPPSLPVGDVVAPGHRLSRTLIRAWLLFARRVLPAFTQDSAERVRGIFRNPIWGRFLEQTESRISVWPVASTLFPLLILVMIGWVIFN
ncbi:MAG: complex I subunit 5 family protein [Pseudohongiellaceae bacterium]